jgi:hypothetical protein
MRRTQCAIQDWFQGLGLSTSATTGAALGVKARRRRRVTTQRKH